MARGQRIALVDDEIDLLEPLADYLTDLGFEVEVALSTAQCEQMLTKARIDLIVLDVNMPGENGLDFLRRIQGSFHGAILMLTANPDDIDRIVGLEAGADDYVSKPVEPQELAARISGILKRRSGLRRDLIHFETVTVDLTASCLLRPGEPPERLGPGEVALLRTFADHPNRVLSRDVIIELAPAEDRDPQHRAIDTRVARLRRKLGTESIQSVRGEGYRFVPPAAGAGNDQR
jgi:DNA-binding response OmpR family regulator